jgi:hypothetical protein
MYYLLNYNALYSAKSLFCLPSAFTLVSSSANSLTLKMEAIYFSEASVDFQRTTHRYTPEDSTLHDHRCENLKFYSSKETSPSKITFMVTNSIAYRIRYKIVVTRQTDFSNFYR